MLEYTVKVGADEVCWYLDDKLHREDGPAIMCADGTKEWYINGKHHREDGPAVKFAGGTEYWYINGEYHREDGPAITYYTGEKRWFLKDKEYTEEEFNKVTLNNPVKKLTIQQIIDLLGYEVEITKE